jgi:hypothetical protein
MVDPIALKLVAPMKSTFAAREAVPFLRRSYPYITIEYGDPG